MDDVLQLERVTYSAELCALTRDFLPHQDINEQELMADTERACRELGGIPILGTGKVRIWTTIRKVREQRWFGIGALRIPYMAERDEVVHEARASLYAYRNIDERDREAVERAANRPPFERHLQVRRIPDGVEWGRFYRVQG